MITVSSKLSKATNLFENLTWFCCQASASFGFLKFISYQTFTLPICLPVNSLKIPFFLVFIETSQLRFHLVPRKLIKYTFQFFTESAFCVVIFVLHWKHVQKDNTTLVTSCMYDLLSVTMSAHVNAMYSLSMIKSSLYLMVVFPILVPPLSCLTSCTPAKPIFYCANLLTAVFSQPDSQRSLIIRIPPVLCLFQNNSSESKRRYINL